MPALTGSEQSWERDVGTTGGSLEVKRSSRRGRRCERSSDVSPKSSERAGKQLASRVQFAEGKVWILH